MRFDGAGVAGGGVNNPAGIVVIVHKFLVRRGELRNEIIHYAERFIQAVKLGVNVAGDGFAGYAGVARFGDEQIVGGNRTLSAAVSLAAVTP